MREFNEKVYHSRSEYARMYADETFYKKNLTIEKNKRIITRALLDSSLIFPTVHQLYTHKIIQCGDYYQVYNYLNPKVKKRRDVEKIDKYDRKKRKQIDFDIELENLDIDYFKDDGLFSFRELIGLKGPPDFINQIPSVKKDNEKEIEKKNINRTKLEVQRLVKTNENDFLTFITLTFKEEIGSIEEANKKFDIWRTKVQSVLKAEKKELKYICIPEYQKNREKKFGIAVVHYHLLTNLDINNSCIIIPQKEFSENQLKKMTPEQRKKCYDVKYWKYGYSSVFPVKDLNVTAYLTKYMTKDIDNRLWGKRRYLSSHNLKKPCVVYYDGSTDDCFYRLLDIHNKCNCHLETYYADPTGEPILFQEWKVCNNV